MRNLKESFRNARGGRRVMIGVGIGIAGLTAMAGFVLMFGLLVQALWNGIIPDVLGVRPLSYWQAVGLLILSRLLVGGFRGGSHGGGRWRRRHRFHGSRGPEGPRLDEFVEHGRRSPDVV